MSFYVSVLAEEARSRLGRCGGGGLLPEARCVDISGLLVEGLGGGSTFIGDPPMHAFGIGASSRLRPRHHDSASADGELGTGGPSLQVGWCGVCQQVVW